MTCIYSGSFDPIHKGHLEVARVLVDRQLVQRVIICPNNPNKSKPWRSPLKNRLGWIREALVSEKREIAVSEEPADEVAEKNATIAVMGSDQFNLLSVRNKLPPFVGVVRRWFIVPRTDHPIATYDLPSSWSRACLVISFLSPDWFHFQDLSSTLIRQEIRARSLVAGGGSTRCPVEWIKKGTVALVDGKWIVKFPGGSHEHEWIRDEYASFLKFKEEKTLSTFVPVEVKFAPEDNVLMTSFEGPCVSTAEDMHAVGVLLRRLHDHAFERAIRPRVDFMSNARWANTLRFLEGVIETKDIDPRRDFARGHVHGDASVLNFVVRPDTKEVCMIDCAGIARYGCSGIPADEYYQFLSSIEWKLKGDSNLATSFRRGYGTPMWSAITDRVFSVLWQQKYSMM